MAGLIGYSNYKEIVIDHLLVSGDLDNFIFYYNLAGDADIGSIARADGYDVVFTLENGTTILDYERVLFSIVGGLAYGEFHIKIPALSSNADTTILINYGKADATDSQNKTGTWDDGGNNYYEGVYHLNQDPSGTAPQMTDSTVNAVHGTAVGMTSAMSVVDGIGKCVDLSNSGYISLPSSFMDGVTTGTFSVIVKPDTIGNNQYYTVGVYNLIIGKASAADDAIGFSDNVNNKIAVKLGSAPVLYGNTSVSAGQPMYITVTWSPSGVKLYLDGLEDATSTHVVSWFSSSYATLIGRGWVGSTQGSYSGLVDEFRASTIDRSGDQIATEYANLSSPATFYSVGTEQENGSGTTVNISSSVSGTGASTANVSIRKTISSSVSGTGSSTANISIAKSISSTATGTGSNTSTITILKNISSSSAGSGSTTATATVTIEGSLSSTVTGTGTSTATVSITKSISSSVSGSGTSATTISIKKNVSSSISGTGSSSATATASTGEFSGVGGLYPSGLYPVGLYPTGLYPRFSNVSTINISSTVVGSGSSTARISISKRVSSSVSGSGSSTATVTVTVGTINISSTITGTGTSTARVSILKNISSSVSGTGSSTASIYPPVTDLDYPITVTVIQNKYSVTLIQNKWTVTLYDV
jgi:hypothetical protein